MAIVLNQRVIVGPLIRLNELFKDGIGSSVSQLAALWSDVKSRSANDDWQLDMSSFDATEMNHIKEHWLGIGANAWFPSADAASVLEQGFAQALSVAGTKPVAAVWVPAESFDSVTVSVVEHPTSVVVVLTSPMPPEGAPQSAADPNVTEYSAPLAAAE